MNSAVHDSLILRMFDESLLNTLIMIPFTLGLILLSFNTISFKKSLPHVKRMKKISTISFFVSIVPLGLIFFAESIASFFIFCCNFICFSLFFVFLYASGVLLTDLLCMKKNIEYADTKFGRFDIGFFDFFHKLKEFVKKNKSLKLSFVKRLLYITPSVILFVYMPMVFGVCETFFGNLQEWIFSFEDIYPLMISVIGIAVVLSFIIAIFVRTENIKFISFVIALLSTCMYIQNLLLNGNMFINGSHSEVTLTSVLLNYGNLILWTGVICAGVFFYIKYTSVFSKTALCVSASLLVMQIVPIPVLLSDYTENRPSISDVAYDFDGSDQFTVASNENVVVFVMDGYSRLYLDYAIKSDESVSNRLSDFVYFDNISTDTWSTALSLPHLFTAHDIDYTIPLLESHKNAWNSESCEYFYNTLHDNGYDVRLYSENINYTGSAEAMLDKIDNIKEFQLSYDCDSLGVYCELLKLSLYKYSPDVFKFGFWISGSETVNLHVKEKNNRVSNISATDWAVSASSTDEYRVSFSNDEYYKNLLEKIHVSDEHDKSVVFVHLHGMHEPYFDINHKESDYKDALKVVMDEFFAYVDFLKDNDLYDNATIILTADHGTPIDSYDDSTSDLEFLKAFPVFLMKTKNRHADCLETNHFQGYLQEDFLPTIMDALGFDTSEFNGKSLLSESDSNRERLFRLFSYSYDFPPANKISSFGSSVSNCYSEYTFTDDIKTAFKSEPDVVKPITDFWW